MQNNDKKNTKDKEEINMAAITKPSVFEVSVTQKEKEKIDEVRLTKSFLDDCLKVAKKLRKGNADNNA